MTTQNEIAFAFLILEAQRQGFTNTKQFLRALTNVLGEGWMAIPANRWPDLLAEKGYKVRRKMKYEKFIQKLIELAISKYREVDYDSY